MRQGELVEAELDAFIGRRSRGRDEGQRRIEELWAESERRHTEQTRRENRAAWYAHEMKMSEIHAVLSAEHKEKAEALLSSRGEGGS